MGGLVDSRTERRFEDLFKKLDKDRNDYLDRSELGDFRRLLERTWDLGSKDRLLEGMSSSRVPRNDFVSFMKELIERAFDRLDTERRGYLTRAEIWELAREFGQHELDFLTELDRDSNKKIDKSEFRAFACDVITRDVGRSKFSDGIVKIVELAATYNKRREGRSLGAVEDGFLAVHEKLDKEGSRVALNEVDDLGSLLKEEWQLERHRSGGSALLDLITAIRRSGSNLSRYKFVDFSMTVLQEAFETLDENKNGKIEHGELREFSRNYYSSGSGKDLVPGLEEKFDTYRNTGLSRLDFYYYISMELLKGANGSRYRGVMKALIKLVAPGYVKARRDTSSDVIDFNKEDKNKNKDKDDSFKFEDKKGSSRLDDSRRSDDFTFESDTGLSRTRDSVMTLGDSLASTDKSRVERFDKSKKSEKEDTIIEELDSFDFES